MKKYTVNESNTDRLIRIVIGLFAFYLAINNFSGLIQILSFLVAILMFITAASGYCLIYQIFGMSTLPKKKK